MAGLLPAISRAGRPAPRVESINGDQESVGDGGFRLGSPAQSVLKYVEPRTMARKAYPEHIRRLMTGYLTHVLCPALGIEPVFDEIALPRFGVKSYLLLVRPRSSDPFVLRCVLKPASAVQLLRNAELAIQNELPMARVVYAEFSSEHFRRHGFGVIVEEMIEGEHLGAGRLDDPRLDQLGEMFARLHSVESDRWGPPGHQSSRSYFDGVIAPKIRRRLRSIGQHDEQFRRAWRREILGFVKSFRRRWSGAPPYVLTHDKINRGNILFPPEGSVRMIDIESLCYGMGGKDLTAATYYFCSDDGQHARLKRSYFSRVAARHADHYEQFEPLYRVWHHLSRWAARAHDLDRARRKSLKAPIDPSPTSDLRNVEREAVWTWLSSA